MAQAASSNSIKRRKRKKQEMRSVFKYGTPFTFLPTHAPARAATYAGM